MIYQPEKLKKWVGKKLKQQNHYFEGKKKIISVYLVF